MRIITLVLTGEPMAGAVATTPVLKCELEPLGVKFRVDLWRATWNRSHSHCCDAVFRQARTVGAKPQCSACQTDFRAEDIRGSLGASMENLFDGVDPLRSVVLASELSSRMTQIVELEREDTVRWPHEAKTFEGPL